MKNLAPRIKVKYTQFITYVFKHLKKALNMSEIVYGQMMLLYMKQKLHYIQENDYQLFLAFDGI